MSQQLKETDQHAAIEDVVGRILLIGTVVSSVLTGIGIAGLVLNLAPPLSERLVIVGLMALVATPVLRVVSSLITYLRERDFIFSAICAVVLAVLGIGVFLGNAH